MSSSEVIDIDFEPDLREYPRHIRKSTERLLHRLKRPPLLDGQDEVLRAVLAYCSRNPNCDDIDLIVEQCHAFLNNKIASFGGAAVRASPNPSSNGNDHSLEEDIDALVQMLPNHGEKAFLRFLNQKPELERSRYLKRVLYRAVKEFCETYPDVKNVHSVLKYVRNTLHDDNQLIDLLDPLEVDLTESSQSNNDCIVIDDAYDLTTNSSSSSSSNSGAISGRTISRGVTLTPRDRILRIFPDAIGSKIDILLQQQAAALASMEMNEQADENAVVNLIGDEQYEKLAKSDLVERAVELVVQFMLEKGYEKASVEARQSQKAEPDCAAGPDYGSQSHITLTTPSAVYTSQAKVLLEHNFPFLRVQGLQKLLLKNNNHYYPTMMEIESNLSTKAFFGDVKGWSGCRLGSFAHGWENLHKEDEQELSRAISASDHCYIRAKCQMSSLGLTAKVVKTARFDTLDSIVTEEELKKELRWVLKKRIVTTREERVRLTEVNIQLQAELEGALIDCGCCCSPFAFELLVQCSEGHLFCRECLQRYAEQTVFGDGRSNLKCMDSSGSVPCGGRFSDATLKKVLSDKVFGKYQEALTRDALKAANIRNLVACFSCGMQVMMDDDAGQVLDCPSCGVKTCKLCGEESHIPLRCNEVEKKSDTDRRTKLEEAMTKARVRQCPGANCKTRFYKTEGCNKMVCTCGVLICYICRANISKDGYGHFCQTPLCTHDNCGKCKLFTNSQEDDQQAMLDAGIKTLADMQLLGVAAADGAGGAGQQNVDLQQIEKLLEGGLPKPKPVAAAAAAAAAPIPGQPAYHYHPRMHHPQHPHGVVVRAGGAAVRHAVIHMDDVHRMVHARRRGGVMVQPMHMAMPMPMPMMPQLPVPGHAHVMRNHMPPPAMPLQMNLPPPATPIAAMPIPPQQRPAKAMAIEAHNLEPRGNRKRARVNNDGR